MGFQTQLPGTDQAIAAAAARGWEAVLLVVLVLAVFVFFGYVLRRVLDDALKRETILSERVSMLESEIRTELFQQMRANSEIMTRVVSAADHMGVAADRMIVTLDRFETTLASRPCLATLERYAHDVLSEIHSGEKKHTEKQS